MIISIEPIGSIPRPLRLIQAIGASGDHADPKLDSLYEKAIRDTIERFEATGSPVITDGEQRNITISGPIAWMDFPTPRRMVSKFPLPPAISAICRG